jgi:hypothetical protein
MGSSSNNSPLQQYQGFNGSTYSSSPLHTAASTPNSPLLGPLPSSPSSSAFNNPSVTNPALFPNTSRHMRSYSQSISAPSSSSPPGNGTHVTGPTPIHMTTAPGAGTGTAGAGLSPPPPQHYLRDISKTPDAEESIKRLKKKSEIYDRNRKSIKNQSPSTPQSQYPPSSLHETRPASPSTVNDINETLTGASASGSFSRVNREYSHQGGFPTTEFAALSEKKSSPSADATSLPSAHQHLLHLQEQQSGTSAGGGSGGGGKRWSFLDKDPMDRKPASTSSRANSISERETALFNARRSLEEGAAIAAAVASNNSTRRPHSEPSAEFMVFDTTRSASSSRRGSFRTANSGGSTSGRLHQSHRAKGSESSLSLSSNTSSSAFPPSLDLRYALFLSVN